MRPAALLRWLVLLYLVYAAQHQLRVAELESGLFGGIIIGTHELGHLVFTPFGEVLGAAACGCWLAVSVGNLAVYVADARAESLDLVSFGPDGGVHDWNFLLERFGVLRHDVRIAAIVRVLGWMVLTAGAGLAAHALVRPRNTDPAAT